MTKRTHSPAFKAKVAFAAAKQEKTVAKACKSIWCSSKPNYTLEEGTFGETTRAFFFKT